MAQEKKLDDLHQAELFKASMFGHGVMTGDRELYFKMYPADFGLSEEEEAELEWVVPDSEWEAQTLMDQLRSTGWTGG